MKKKITTLITYYYGGKYFKDLIISIRKNIIPLKDSINLDLIIINDSSNFEEEKNRKYYSRNKNRKNSKNHINK